MMRAPIKALAVQLDELHGYFLKALDLGEEARLASDTDEIVRFVDERRRVELNIESTTHHILLALQAIESDPATSRSELAFLQEKRNRTKDLAPRFNTQNAEMRRTFSKRLESMRVETVSLRRNTQAIQQYISAPGSKPRIH